MASMFGEILKLAATQKFKTTASKEAIDWFKTQTVKIRNVNDAKLMTSNKDNLRNPPPSIGSMMMFYYQPKTKADLPYYDSFPLVFPIERYKGGFLGINLHYLPIPLRAKLMDGLYSYINNVKMDQTTKLRISYKILQSASRMKLFKPCIKHYLTDHIRSRMLWIDPKEWNIALFLPTERFQKATKQQVHADSREIINNA